MADHRIKYLASVVSTVALACASQPASAQIVRDDGAAPDVALSAGGSQSGNDSDSRSGDGRRGQRQGQRHRVTVSPYIEVGQVLSADLSAGGDTLTYSTVAAGVDASIASRRAEATASVRYEHRFSWNGTLGDNDVVSGLARARVNLAQGLALEGGALATTSSVDGRGGTANFPVGDRSNRASLYSFYAGPTFGRRIGDLDVGAAYRFGYSKSEVDFGATLPTGAPVVGSFDDATNHAAIASIGMRPGRLPFGWRLSGGWDREDAGQLDQRYEGLFGRLDVTVPVTPTLAVLGGVGYEDISVSYRPPVLGTDGQPVTDGSGRLVADAAQPRQIAFDTSGLIYDAGVLYRPSRRMTLEAHVGHRYDDWSYTGSWSFQASANTAYQLAVYDSISTVGRQLSAGLAALPTNFSVSRNPIDGSIGDCAFGQGGGTCLSATTGNLSGLAFRNRGVVLSSSSRFGLWNLGVAIGYDRRYYLTRGAAVLAAVDGKSDETVYAFLSAQRPIGENTAFGMSAYANWFSSGLGNSPDTISAGTAATLSHNFVPRLTGNAAVSFNTINQDGFNTRYYASALLGLRYGF